MRAWVLVVVLVATACSEPEVQAVDPEPVAVSFGAVMEVGEPDGATVRAGALKPTQVKGELDAVLAKMPQHDDWPTPLDITSQLQLTGESHVLECATTRMEGGEREPAELGPAMFKQVAQDDAAGFYWQAVTHGWRASWAWSESTHDDPEQLVLQTEQHSLLCRNPRVTSIRSTLRDALGAHVYAALLTTPNEPTFVEPLRGGEPQPEDRRRINELHERYRDDLSAISALELLREGPESGDHAWLGVIAAQTKAGHLDLAYELHRRSRPIGRCSQDRGPQGKAAKFADVCKKLGKHRCHLAVTTTILQHRFARRTGATVNGKPASYVPAVDMLPPEVDPAFFLLGLVLDFAQSPYEDHDARMLPMSLGIVLGGSEVADDVEQTLLRWLRDPDLDPLNRHVLTTALYSIRVFAWPNSTGGCACLEPTCPQQPDIRCIAHSVAAEEGAMPLTAQRLISKAGE